ncbi:MAG: FliA/WhiG family RNA polymerase sigma factor [Clostridiales bacterium]|nr:FliA/WhiG family RNA polymerase sigma factor [Clostridiales bacterium]
MADNQEHNDRLDDPVEMMEAYKRTKDLETRNRLVMHYAPAVRHTIISMRSILPQNIAQEEFYHQGILALIDCIEKYDPGRGASFGTFIFKHLRGAMLSYMRKHSWLPYRVRAARRSIIAARTELSNQLMREPTDQELAEYMDIPPRELNRNLQEIAAADMISFEEMMAGGSLWSPYDGGAFKGSRVYDPPDDSVDRDMMQGELREALAAAIDGLGPKEKQVISLCYYENLNLREIGEVLNVSQQRISFIRSQALVKLRKVMVEYLHGEEEE